MDTFSRFAVYYTPGPGAFADAAACWLGWDSAAGRAVPQPDLPALPRSLPEVTATPRKYGFHGTLKPPFRLAPGTDAQGLAAAAAALAARIAPVAVPGLAMRRLGSFLALVPEDGGAALAPLASDVVASLDRFRAPLTEAEIARRRPDRLSPRQRDLLDRFGYPFVMDEFRFHLTLTGPLDGAEGDALAEAATAHFAGNLPRPFRLDALTVLGEGADGRFRVIARHPLAG